MHRPLLIVLVVLSSLFSCVSKRQYDLTVESARTVIDSLKRTSAARIQQLEYELTRNMGVNDALLLTQDRLFDRLDTLKAEIDRLESMAQSSNQNFSGQLQEAAAEQARLQGKLDAIKGLINQRLEETQTIAATIRDSLSGQNIEVAYLDINAKGGQAIIHLNEELLFRGTSTERLETNGQQALLTIGKIVQQFPVQTLQVVGHTDNTVASRSYDNWQYSALRAVSVVQFLVENAGLGPNRVVAVGNSEFAPIQSNSTPEGRAANRRITILVQPRQADLIRDIGRMF